MTDIVERLRRKVFRGPTMEASHTKTVEWLAADEIERLRALVDQCHHHEHQLQAINAEVDKLRADSEGYLSLAASYKSDLDEHTATIKRLRDQMWRNNAELTGFTPTRLLMRQLFEDQDTTLTLDIGYFGDGVDDSVNVGPNPGFSSDCLVLAFREGSQHGFSRADAPHVRQLIQAMLGWLDYIEARQKEERG